MLNQENATYIVAENASQPVWFCVSLLIAQITIAVTIPVTFVFFRNDWSL